MTLAVRTDLRSRPASPPPGEQSEYPGRFVEWTVRSTLPLTSAVISAPPPVLSGRAGPRSGRALPHSYRWDNINLVSAACEVKGVAFYTFFDALRELRGEPAVEATREHLPRPVREGLR